MEIAVFVEVVEAVDDAVNVEEDCYLVCGVVIHCFSYWSATCCVVAVWYVLWFSHREERGYGSRQKGKPATTNKKGDNMVLLPP